MGFRRAKGVTSGWTKAGEDRTLSIWIQCEKYGWSADWGSEFTCELQYSVEPEIGASDIGNRARYCHLLNADELEAVRSRNNQIISQLPGFLAGRVVTVTDSEGIECAVVGHRPTAGPYHPGHDNWMHYLTEEDVVGWGAFLSGIVPTLLERVRARAR